ncbi:PREDICTED: uncharacterized protein LOC108559107 [Nicrophorus vespilloides]|uniref:Uncharacterized protein LOC108559107 n=1 Tax=Nicrophorus vespilloides TaxID=110193 RepID=A0ABM1MAZ1_NICVS|nr:PREDICTED: uncharacterized protein LOC108559107 [Nicrophorus vespilloides]
MKSFGLSFLAFALLAAHISAIPLENEINSNDSNESGDLKTIANCAEEGGFAGVMNCAAMRALKSLQYIAKQPSLEIVPGITLNSDNPNVQRSGKSLSDEELPKDPQEKANKLYSLILDNAASVVSGRTLKISMPENVSESVSRALEEGGSLDFLPGRKKKKGSMIPSYVLAIGAKMIAIVPVIMGGLALLTTKALIVAKIALVLSGIVFFQYLGNKGSTIFSGITGNSNGYGGAVSSGGYGGGAHGFSTGYGSGSYNPSTWTTNSLGGGAAAAGAGGSYARSIDVAEEAQKMAYSASVKKQN